jgi:hypothetical protein
MSKRIHIWSRIEVGPRVALNVVNPVGDPPANAPWLPALRPLTFVDEPPDSGAVEL